MKVTFLNNPLPKNVVEKCKYLNYSSSPGGSAVKNLPAIQESWLQSLGWEDPLEEGMATHSSLLAWWIPRPEEPGGLQCTGSQSRTQLKWPRRQTIHRIAGDELTSSHLSTVLSMSAFITMKSPLWIFFSSDSNCFPLLVKLSKSFCLLHISFLAASCCGHKCFLS